MVLKDDEMFSSDRRNGRDEEGKAYREFLKNDEIIQCPFCRGRALVEPKSKRKKWNQ